MWTSIEKLSFLDSKKKLNNEYGIFPCAKNIFFILEQDGKKFGQCVVGENKIFIALYTIIFIILRMYDKKFHGRKCGIWENKNITC